MSSTQKHRELTTQERVLDAVKSTTSPQKPLRSAKTLFFAHASSHSGEMDGEAALVGPAEALVPAHSIRISIRIKSY